MPEKDIRVIRAAAQSFLNVLAQLCEFSKP
jgi:hypothetical protein